MNLSLLPYKQYMRQVPLASSTAPGICRNPPCLNENNQSEPERVFNTVAVTTRAPDAKPPSPTLALTQSS